MSILPLYLSSFSSIAQQANGLGNHPVGETQTPKKSGEVDKTGKKQGERQNEIIAKSGETVSENGDILSLSKAAKSKSRESAETTKDSKQVDSDSKLKTDAKTVKTDAKKENTKPLTQEEEKQVAELKKRDAEVKAHEAAHLAAAGGLAQGGASYEYQEGPDGNRYAVGGEVSISTGSIDGDPKATIAKAQQIRAAALAPSQPSSQDYKVAASASKMEASARQQLTRQTPEVAGDKNGDVQGVQGNDKNVKAGNFSGASAEGNRSFQVSPEKSSPASRYVTQNNTMKFVTGSLFQAMA
ncbi:MAG: hypothetical protein FWC50_01315 [Planctomycetaceae bacterium]|nr:hypothetical protein [Planctomycetaceae bacterium]